MKLALKELRKRAGLTQRELADRLDVDWRTYGSWERQERMISLVQACEIADELRCTLDELAGREWDSTEFYSDAFQAELNRCYLACTADRKAGILQAARDGALASGEAAQRAEPATDQIVEEGAA